VTLSRSQLLCTWTCRHYYCLLCQMSN